jgi:hypothetical protein
MVGCISSARGCKWEARVSWGGAPGQQEVGTRRDMGNNTIQNITPSYGQTAKTLTLLSITWPMNTTPSYEQPILAETWKEFLYHDVNVARNLVLNIHLRIKHQAWWKREEEMDRWGPIAKPSGFHGLTLRGLANYHERLFLRFCGREWRAGSWRDTDRSVPRTKMNTDRLINPVWHVNQERSFLLELAWSKAPKTHHMSSCSLVELSKRGSSHSASHSSRLCAVDSASHRAVGPAMAVTELRRKRSQSADKFLRERSRGNASTVCVKSRWLEHGNTALVGTSS